MLSRDTLAMDGWHARAHVLHGDVAQEINLLQLDPPVPMHTPDGYGMALILSDESDAGLLWTVELASGAIRTYSNDQIAGATTGSWATAHAA